MAEGPDVRALTWMAGPAYATGTLRPMTCLGCPFFARTPGLPARGVCALMSGRVLTSPHPLCTDDLWAEHARAELAAVTADNALLTAVARDAREESSMYARGLAEGAAAEREACCKAVCGRCAAGDPAVLHHGVWCHRSLTHGPALVGPCKADAVRRRAEEDGR